MIGWFGFVKDSSTLSSWALDLLLKMKINQRCFCETKLNISMSTNVITFSAELPMRFYVKSWDGR